MMEQASINAAESELYDNHEVEMKLIKLKFKDTKDDLVSFEFFCLMSHYFLTLFILNNYLI